MHFILFLFIGTIKAGTNSGIENGPTNRYCKYSTIGGNEITIVKDSAGDPPSEYHFCQNLQNKKFTVNIDELPELFFYGSNVESVTLAATVKTIGTGVFAFCPFLKLTIVEGSAFTEIGEGAFYKSTLSPSSQIKTNPLPITTLGKHAFYYCSLPTLSVKLGNNVLESAFEHCRVSSNGKLSVQFDRGTGNSKTFSIYQNAFAYSSIEKYRKLCFPIFLIKEFCL